MTREERFLGDLLDMQEAASEAIGFVAGRTLETLERDILTQRAVAMSFVLIAAAASRIFEQFPNVVSEHPEIAWSKIRGLHDVVVHEYETLDWRLVWDTVHRDLPTLVAQIDQLRHPHIQGE
ncbi:HepT-like ribonuclease domain-containing protein [Rhizobium sp. CAU 1783]